MLQETTRPFTEAERRLLKRRSAVPKPGSVYWMRDERWPTVATISICAAILLICEWLHFYLLGALLAGLVGLIGFSSIHRRRMIRRHVLAHRRALAEELEFGQAHSIICTPTRVIEREELEDEGMFWIFDGGDGRYLALCGHELYESPRFPSAHFEVVRGPRRGWIIGIRSRGPRIPSTLVVDAEKIEWASFPAQGVAVFAAPPNAELPEILRCYDLADAAVRG